MTNKAHNVQLHASPGSDAPVLTAHVEIRTGKGVRAYIVERPVYGNAVALFDDTDTPIRADKRHGPIIDATTQAMASRRDLMRPFFLV